MHGAEGDVAGLRVPLMRLAFWVWIHLAEESRKERGRVVGNCVEVDWSRDGVCHSCLICLVWVATGGSANG